MKLVRDSQPTSQPSKNATLVSPLPLCAGSTVMKAMLSNCEAKAKHGNAVAIRANIGDLMEAPALFKHLALRLKVARYAVVLPGKEKATLSSNSDAEGLFFINASQIPIGIQTLLVDEYALRLRLNILCLPEQKGVDPEQIFTKDFLDYCGEDNHRFVHWPRWNERQDDWDKIIYMIMRWLAQSFGMFAELEEDALEYLKAHPWKSVGHLTAHLMNAVCAKQAAGKDRMIYLEDLQLPPPSSKRPPAFDKPAVHLSNE